MICQDCGTPMRVIRTTVAIKRTTRVHLCTCGSRFESEEAITGRMPGNSRQVYAHMHTNGQGPPLIDREQPPVATNSGGGVGGGLSSGPNSVLFPLSSVPSEQSGSVSEGDQRVDQARVRGPAYSAGFVGFWAAYPRKVAKGAAWKAWPPAAVHLDAILAALEWQRTSDAWQRDGGAYVPHPATWLNARRWEDEPSTSGTAIPEKARHSRAASLGWLEKKERQSG